MSDTDLFNVVAGVDFSGAKATPNETWLATGVVDSEALEITKLVHVGSHKLGPELTKTENLAVLGLDFPFSFPTQFLTYLAEKRGLAEFQSWQGVAECLAFLSYEDFEALVTAFDKEPKRYADQQSKPMGISPLHRGNPSMIQMTYHGVRLLAMLDPNKFAVQPFQAVKPGACQVLEVYPSATLYAGGIAHKGYKRPEKKEQHAMFDLRKQMIRDLEHLHTTGGEVFKEWPKLLINPKLESTCITSDHAFDAVVACYTAAVFFRSPKAFADPLDSNNLEVLTEGWIYAPFVKAEAKPNKPAFSR